MNHPNVRQSPATGGRASGGELRPRAPSHPVAVAAERREVVLGDETSRSSQAMCASTSSAEGRGRVERTKRRISSAGVSVLGGKR